VNRKAVNFFSLHKLVREAGGSQAVASSGTWPVITAKLGHTGDRAPAKIAEVYRLYLSDLESACAAHTLMELCKSEADVDKNTEGAQRRSSVSSDSTAVSDATAASATAAMPSAKSKRSSDGIRAGQTLWRYFCKDGQMLWVCVYLQYTFVVFACVCVYLRQAGTVMSALYANHLSL